jgi:glycosyltransferase involved in cell wall biosynthesis
MNILHVLSGDFVTGAETSTAALIRRQTASGHKVFVAAGRFDHPVRAEVAPIPIYNRGLLRRLLNILALRRFIRKNHIDLVHAHSRAASWVGFWACRLTQTPYLSTLHGRQHLHFSNRWFNIYGNTVLTMCEDIREQMLGRTQAFRQEQLIVLRNGLEP